MSDTRPKSEQLEFRSAKTGSHNLDTYLEAAERGGRTLPQLLADVFDDSGQLHTDLFELRFDETDSTIEARVRASADAGPDATPWNRVTTFFRWRGDFVAATGYANFDLIRSAANDIYLVHGLGPNEVVVFGSEAEMIASPSTVRLVDVSDAREWATKMDGPVDGTGEFSAKFSATQAARRASSARASYSGASLHERNAKLARDKARLWAGAPEDTEVEPNEYSAFHWAEKAKQTPGRILYVTANGSDAYNGESLLYALASIDRAVELAAATTDPVAIYVYPGEYITSGHIDVPDNVTGVVAATNSRSTKIRPSAGNEARNVFRMGDQGYLEGFSFEGWQLDDLTDPSEGFALSFRPGAVIRRALFAFNVTVYRPQPATLMPPPLNRANANPEVGNGPGVALADKSVPSGYSPYPQIMLWGATPVCPNGVGYCAKNGGFINAINAVGLWMHKHYLALSGGRILLTNCASQFGDWSLWAEGTTPEVLPVETSATLVTDSAAADAIAANQSSIIDQMWADLQNAGYTSLDETATRRDAALFLLSLEYDLRSGQQESAQRFVRGLFDHAGNFVAPGAQAAFIASFQSMRDQVRALSAVTGATDTMVTALTQLVVDTINAPVFRDVPSQITSVGHQWNNTMAGVNGRAFNRPSLEVPDSIVERDRGRVIYSGIDDSGRQYFTGGALVNPLTGRLEGPPITRTIDPRARRAALMAAAGA